MTEHYQVSIASRRALPIAELPAFSPVRDWDWLFELLGDTAADAVVAAQPATVGALMEAIAPFWDPLSVEAAQQRVAAMPGGRLAHLDLARPATLGTKLSKWLPAVVMRELLTRSGAPPSGVELVRLELDVTPLVEGVSLPVDDVFAERAWVLSALTEGQRDYFDPGVNPIYSHFETHYGEGAWAQPGFGGGEDDVKGIVLQHRWHDGEGVRRVVVDLHPTWVPWAEAGATYRVKTA